MKKQENLLFHPLVVTRVDRHIWWWKGGVFSFFFIPFSNQQLKEEELFFIHFLWAVRHVLVQGSLFFISFRSSSEGKKSALFHPLVVARAVGLPHIDGWNLSFLIRGSLPLMTGHCGDWCHQFLFWLQLFSYIKYNFFGASKKKSAFLSTRFYYYYYYYLYLYYYLIK